MSFGLSTRLTKFKKWITGKRKEERKEPQIATISLTEQTQDLEPLDPKTQILLQSNVDSEREKQIRSAQVEALRSEEQTYREQLVTVLGVLTEMERVHTATVQEEDKHLRYLQEEHRAFNERCQEKINQLKTKQTELMEELEKFDLEVITLEKDLMEEMTIKEALTQNYNEITKALKKLITNFRQESKAFSKKIKDFETSAAERHKNTAEDVRRYQIAKQNLESCIKELHVVRLSLEEPVPEDSKDHETRLRAAITEINGCPEPLHIDSISDIKIRGYHVTENLVRKSSSSQRYLCKKQSKQGKEKVVVAMITPLKAIDKDLLKILMFLKRHPFIHLVKTHDVFIIGEMLVLIEDVMSTNLEAFVAKEGPMNENRARTNIKSLLLAIQYLHCHGVAHQGVTPTNIFFHESGILKLGCLEHATVYWDMKRSKAFEATTINIQPKWQCVAPELSSGSRYNPARADLYAAGITLCFMLLGKYPCDKQGQQDERQQWISSKDELKKKSSCECMDLIFRLTQVNPDKRISASSAVTHNWFKANIL